MSTSNVKKKKFAVPHTWALLFIGVVVAAALTYVVPAGEFDRMDVDGRTVVVDGSYHKIDSNKAGIFDVFLAFPKGLEAASQIVFFLFVVGGAFHVVQETGAINAGIAALVRKTAGYGFLIIPLISMIFAFGGGLYGMAEETLPFIPVLVALSISMGYDSMVGVAIVLAATCAGFTGAFLNPFTIGVAQGIAGLPLYSGIGYRIIIFIVSVTVTITYIMRYAHKIKKDPTKSIVYDIDQQRDINIDIDNTPFTAKHKLILLTMLLTFVILVYGVISYGWYMQELCALFLAMAIVSGLISGKGVNNFTEEFVQGCSDLAFGALVVGLARGILIIFEDALVIDTMINGLANSIKSLPPSLTSLGIYIAQIIISAVVPSGSGMAALTMPVLAPLADVVGVTRQTTVLAFQFADGFTNILTPLCGYFMAALAMAGIPYQKWMKWILPLAIIWWVMGGIFIVIAANMGYGPF